MQDRIIAVTGSAGALGSAVVRRLSASGAKVVGIDLAPQAAAPELALALGGVDLGDPAAVTQAFASIRDRFPALHGLVNVAGGFRWETVADGTVETWDRLYAMNVRSALLASQSALPLLLAEGGAIVNIGAAAAQKADMGMGAYAASKAGVARLTESLAAELKDRGIRVNAVLPSILDTALNRADMPQAEFDRWVSPDALADVIAFLLSDAARAITGALLPVTGRV